MALTRKHFEALAAIAAGISDQPSRVQITAELVRFCHAENSRFDAERFRDRVAELMVAPYLKAST